MRQYSASTQSLAASSTAASRLIHSRWTPGSSSCTTNSGAGDAGLLPELLEVICEIVLELAIDLGGIL